MTVYLAIAGLAWVALWPATTLLSDRRISPGTAAALAAVLAAVWPLTALALVTLAPHRRRSRR